MPSFFTQLIKVCEREKEKKEKKKKRKIRTDVEVRLPVCVCVCAHGSCCSLCGQLRACVCVQGIEFITVGVFWFGKEEIDKWIWGM